MANESSKQRAGALISRFLRNIAEEETELIIDGDDQKMVTKAEALARLVFKRALGFSETRINDEGNEVTVVHQPDKTYIAMVWDRLEGRVANVTEDKKKTRKVADRVGEQSAQRIKNIAKKSVE